MPTMVMPRDYFVRTTHGYSVRFRKNNPTHVPENMFVIDECQRFGAEFVDPSDAPVLEDERTGPDTSRLPKTAKERNERIIALLEEMRDNSAAHRDHFTAGNKPRAQYVRDTLGFDLRGDEVLMHWKNVVHKPEAFED